MMYMCDDQIQDFKYYVLTHLPRGARELYCCWKPFLKRAHVNDS